MRLGVINFENIERAILDIKEIIFYWKHILQVDKTQGLWEVLNLNNMEIFKVKLINVDHSN